MRDVDQQHVGARTQELRGPFEIVAACADGRPDAQPPVTVARRERQPALPQQVT